MSRKRYTPEQIIGMLREAEVGLAPGETVGPICRRLGISEQSYYRWRREYGGMKVDQARRLKDLERENGYNESFNGKLRDELLNTEIFSTLKEAQVLIERWRQHYNTIRPHSSLGYRPPAPQTILPRPAVQAYATLQPAQLGIKPRRTLS